MQKLKSKDYGLLHANAREQHNEITEKFWALPKRRNAALL